MRRLELRLIRVNSKSQLEQQSNGAYDIPTTQLQTGSLQEVVYRLCRRQKGTLTRAACEMQASKA